VPVFPSPAPRSQLSSLAFLVGFRHKGPLGTDDGLVYRSCDEHRFSTDQTTAKVSCRRRQPNTSPYL